MDLSSLALNGLSWLSLICLILAAAGCLYSLAAAFCAGRYAAQAVPQLAPGAPRPSVTVLKPLCGLEPYLYENLETVLRQDYAGPVQVIFGVQKTNDPAIGVVDRLRQAYPAARIDLVIDGRQHGSNRKVSNLINMAERIAHDVVVLADSDMLVRPDYLERLVAELSQDGVSGVTCLYHGVPAYRGLYDQLSTLAIDTHFLPNVVMGLSLGLAKPCFGSTIAFTRASLDAVGGFRSFRDDLADDYAIGAALRGLGGRVVIPSFSIGHTSVDTDLSGLWQHELRWNRTIRNVDPAGRRLGRALGRRGGAGEPDPAVPAGGARLRPRPAPLRTVADSRHPVLPELRLGLHVGGGDMERSRLSRGCGWHTDPGRRARP
jgi:ceramide glucosyltransferase